MANNTIFNSQCFKWVLSFDPEQTNIQWDKAETYAASINEVAQKVIAIIPTLTSKQDQKIVKQFEQQLAVLNEKFESEGNSSLFDQSIEALVLTSSAFEKELSPQVASLLKSDDLNEILRGEGDKKAHLKAFLKELHSVLQDSSLSKKDLAALQKVAQKCYQLSQEYSGTSIEPLMASIIGQFKCHAYLQSPIYQNILNYQKGMLKGKDPALVGQEMTKLANQLAALAQNPDNPIDEKELLQVYENIKVIHQEFLGHSGFFTEALDKMRGIPQVKEGMFKRFQEGLKKLDLSSPSLQADVEKLKRILGEIYPKSHPELLRLQAYLNELAKPTLLKPTANEEKFVEWVKTKHPKLKNADYAPIAESVTRQAQSKLLSIMQENSGSLESLSGAVQQKLPVLQKQTMKYRFSKLLEKHGVKSKNLANRFPALVDSFEKFTYEVATKTFLDKWDAITKVYDRKTHGKFSEIVKQVGHIDMDAEDTEYLIDYAQSKFLEHLHLNEIDTVSEEKFKQSITQAFKETQAALPAAFDEYYESNFKDKHEWVAQNAQYIEVAYDQELDIHRNIGTGTCLQNAMSRQALLLKNPSVASHDIPIGSSQLDRVNAARLKMTIALAKPEQLREAQASAKKLQHELAAKYELEEKRAAVISRGQPPSTKLVEDIASWAKAHKETQLILTFNGPSHAISLQMDEARGIYRFMDDNTGHMRSYPDLKTFKSSFAKYMKAFYPEAQNFTVRTYRKLPEVSPKTAI